MYLQGVSTRRVSKVLEELCALDITSTQVSSLTANLVVSDGVQTDETCRIESHRAQKLNRLLIRSELVG